MAKHLIQDHTGHTTIDFDKLDPAQLKEAGERFDRLLAEGLTAATRKTGEVEYRAPVKDFGATEDETLFMRHHVGG